MRISILCAFFALSGLVSCEMLGGGDKSTDTAGDAAGEAAKMGGDAADAAAGAGGEMLEMANMSLDDLKGKLSGMNEGQLTGLADTLKGQLSGTSGSVMEGLQAKLGAVVDQMKMMGLDVSQFTSLLP